MLDKTLDELVRTIDERKRDTQLLNLMIHGLLENKNSLEFYRFREQERCSSEKINIFILKKQKHMPKRARDRCFKLIFQTIASSDNSQIPLTSLSQSDNGLLDYEATLELLYAFCVDNKVPTERVSVILRQNNPYLLQDFITISLEQSRIAFINNLQQLYLNSCNESAYRLPNSGDRRPLRNLRSKTEAAQKNDQKERERGTEKDGEQEKEKEKKLYIESRVARQPKRSFFQQQHREIVTLVRKKFIQNFDSQRYQNKMIALYHELKYLNSHNKLSIQTFRRKIFGQTSSSESFNLNKNENKLYSRVERKSIVQALSQKLKYQQRNNMATPNGEASEQELLFYIKNLIQKTIRAEKIQQNIENLEPTFEKPLNVWLPISCVVTNELERPLMLSFRAYQNAGLCENEYNQMSLKEKLMAYFSEQQDSIITSKGQSTDQKIAKCQLYKNKIVGCSNQKKLIQSIDVSSKSFNKLKSRSNTTVALPNISKKDTKRSLLITESKQIPPRLPGQLKKGININQKKREDRQQLVIARQTLPLKIPIFNEQ